MLELKRDESSSLCLCPSLFDLEVKLLKKTVWCNLVGVSCVVRASLEQLSNSELILTGRIGRIAQAKKSVCKELCLLDKKIKFPPGHVGEELSTESKK